MLFKVAHYTKHSTFYEPTSQYGNLNILWNSFYQKSWSHVIIMPWSKAVKTQNLSSNLLKILLLKDTTCIIIFLKSYFHQENHIICFWTFVFITYSLIFHNKTTSFLFNKLYPGVMSHHKLPSFFLQCDITCRFPLITWISALPPGIIPVPCRFPTLLPVWYILCPVDSQPFFQFDISCAL